MRIAQCLACALALLGVGVAQASEVERLESEVHELRSIVQIIKDYGEFIAAQPCYGITLPDAFF